MKVLLFGTYDEERHPRVRVLRQGLEKTDVEVRVLNRPIVDSTSARVAAVRSPVAASRWLAAVARAWSSLIKGSLREPTPSVVIVGYLGVLDVVLARLRWPRRFIVLDHMAPLRGVALDRNLGGIAHRLFGLTDRVAERVADLVVFDTEDNAELSSTRPSRQLVVPVGASEEWFRRTLDRHHDHEHPLKVVFFGLFTPLQGAPTIGAAMRALQSTDIEFTMIGVGQDLEECRRRAGPDAKTTWIDWVPSAQLPAIVAEHDVCLGIFGTTPKALRVVPNKVFQGAAAGCALVSLDSEPQRRALGDGIVYVPTGDSVALAETLERFVSDPEFLRHQRQLARRAAEAYDPVTVVGPLLQTIRYRMGPSAGGTVLKDT